VPFTLVRGRTAAAVLGCLGFIFIGWTGLLIPSLIRSVELDFVKTDADMGAFYFIYAVAYATGSFGGGLLTEHLGRRTVLGLALALHAVGFAALAIVPVWPLFLLAAIPAGLGGGEIDGGVNGLFLDLYTTNRGRGLSALHLFYGVGALLSPFFVGVLVEAGVAWQSIALGTAIVMLPLAVLYTLTDMPTGHHEVAETASRIRVGFALPLVALAIGIGCYVAAEIGVSSWLVRFLADAPLRVATGALSLFWLGLTLGRFTSAVLGDRFDHVKLAVLSATVSGLALFAAVCVANLAVSVALFAVVGFAFGPVYPLIMAVAGERFPGRTAAVSGLLSGTAVVGATLYPPVMGFLSVTIGLGAAMLGAGVLALGSAAALLAVRGPAREERVEVSAT
jgi:MFS transporter, OFA family, oxalate/formate antiporter